jgi:hypothetical protein
MFQAWIAVTHLDDGSFEKMLAEPEGRDHRKFAGSGGDEY